MVKAIKVMLIPNNVQKTKLFQYAGASRFAYNWALAKEISKAVQEQGFFGFRKQLEYKCNDKGILLIVADRFYPSSKLCSCCGNIKKDLKPVPECQFFSFFDLFPKFLYLLYQN